MRDPEGDSGGIMHQSPTVIPTESRTIEGPTLPVTTRARLATFVAGALLVPVAGIGFTLSFRPVWQAARPIFGDPYAMLMPLMVDASIAAGAAAYVAGALRGRPRQGWRLLSHLGIAATLTLNALSSESGSDLPWHIAAPLLWAAIVELVASEALGTWRAENATLDRIPWGLWFASPASSARTWLHMRRTGTTSHVQARKDLRTIDAARQVLALACPGLSGRGVRRRLSQQLQDGSLSPYAVLLPLRDLPDSARPADVLKAVYGVVLTPGRMRDAIHAAHGPAADQLAATSSALARAAQVPSPLDSVEDIDPLTGTLDERQIGERARRDEQIITWAHQRFVESQGEWPTESEVHEFMLAHGDSRTLRTAGRKLQQAKDQLGATSTQERTLVDVT